MWMVDKYLLIVLMFLFGGIIIAVTREPFIPGLFYSMVAGAIIVIVYSSWKNKKENREFRRRRGKFKK